MFRRHPRLTLTLALVLVALATLVAFLWTPLRQASAVAAIENGVPEGYPAYFGSSERSSTLRYKVDDVFVKLLEHSPDSLVAPGQAIRREFLVIFRDPVETVALSIPFQGDAGAALGGFPRLRKVIVYQVAGTGEEGDWARLCAGLHACRNLEEIKLYGASITDAAIAPLASHTALRRITIGLGRLTPACQRTFATMTQLTELHISNQESGIGDTMISLVDHAALSAALPKVKIMIDPPIAPPASVK